MKIAWIVNNINQVGGIEQVVCGLASYFVQKLDLEVSIISINTSESKPFFYLDPAVKVDHCNLDWRYQTRSSINQTIASAIRTLDADILLTCHSPISICVLRNRHLFNGKIVITQHCAFDFESKKRRLLNALFYRFADAFVVLNERDEQYYHKLGCRPIVIPNAIYSQIGARATLDDHILLSAGRLTAVKGFDLLIQAFAKVANRHQDWKLCICGDGEDADSLHQLAMAYGVRDRILFPGFVNMSEYMSKAGGFILSSRSEGFSLVLIEAMAHGLPIVGYALPPAKEICGEQGALLVPCGNIEALAEGIDQLLTFEDLRRELGERAYMRSQKYSVSEIAARWIQLFNEITGGHMI